MDKITGLVASFLLGVRRGRIVSAPSPGEHLRQIGSGEAGRSKRSENISDTADWLAEWCGFEPLEPLGKLCTGH